MNYAKSGYATVIEVHFSWDCFVSLSQLNAVFAMRLLSKDGTVPNVAAYDE